MNKEATRENKEAIVRGNQHPIRKIRVDMSFNGTHKVIVHS